MQSFDAALNGIPPGNPIRQQVLGETRAAMDNCVALIKQQNATFRTEQQRRAAARAAQKAEYLQRREASKQMVQQHSACTKHSGSRRYGFAGPRSHWTTHENCPWVAVYNMPDWNDNMYSV
jgi:hypothetical protein